MSLAALVALALVAPQSPPAGTDPTQGEVVLPAAEGFVATLVHRADSGVWYLRGAKVLPHFGCPEIIGCDDKGRLTVLSCYSGKWTPQHVTPDGQWLAPTGPAEVDARVSGLEIYAGGKSGNVHQISLRPRGPGSFDLVSQEIAHFPGEEIHTLVAADLRPRSGGAELLVFAFSGAVHELTPAAGGASGFSARKLGELAGRVRDAVLVPAPPDEAPSLAVVARSGELVLLRLAGAELERKTIGREPMGLGRIARRESHDGAPAVLYVTRDDGLILRFELQPGGEWLREAIYAGPQGPRGIAAGRFHDDPARESIAVFGYSRKVQLVSRAPAQPWRVETIYTDADQGHWLTRVELDGRNGTDELIASTFGGRIVQLGRKPGYALRGIAVADDPPPPTGAASRPASAGALR